MLPAFTSAWACFRCELCFACCQHGAARDQSAEVQCTALQAFPVLAPDHAAAHAVPVAKPGNISMGALHSPAAADFTFACASSLFRSRAARFEAFCC